MNISTYEARIAALEAQLGPGPGPVPETGLVSVIVTPDITLSDGTSLNAKLAAMMPFNSTMELNETAQSLEIGTEYQVTATPGTSHLAIINTTGGMGTPGALGETVTETATVVDSGNPETGEVPSLQFFVFTGASMDVDPTTSLHVVINA